MCFLKANGQKLDSKMQIQQGGQTFTTALQVTSSGPADRCGTAYARIARSRLTLTCILTAFSDIRGDEETQICALSSIGKSFTPACHAGIASWPTLRTLQ